MSTYATVACSSNYVWGIFFISLCLEEHDFSSVRGGLTALCMYPEAGNGAKSSHPSGKHGALPELTLLLPVGSRGGSQLGFKALLLRHGL